MKRARYFMALSALLIFNANALHAADENRNALSGPEVAVVKISASGDGAAISIPRTALALRNGIPGVFVVENNTARFRMVRPGKAGKTQLEILSGLFGGETLVAAELDAVHDGSPIRISTRKSPVKK